MSVGYIYSGGVLTVVAKSKTFRVRNGEGRFHEILDALKNNATEDEVYGLIMSTQSLEDYIEKQGNDRVTVEDGVVKVDGEPLENSVASRISEFKKNNLPIDHLVKFVERAADNPSYHSRNQLYDFLEHKCLVITEDGHFLAYKGVRNDYYDRWSGTIDNSPGRTIKMDRTKIDDNPASHCSKGLHVGALEYASNWACGGKVVIVKVDPANVVSVPNDHSFQKCRVCEYTVLRDAEGKLTQPLYTTTGEPYKPETYDGGWEFADDEVDDVFDDGEVYSYEDDEYEDEYDYDNPDYEEDSVEEEPEEKLESNKLLDILSKLTGVQFKIEREVENDDDLPPKIDL